MSFELNRNLRRRLVQREEPGCGPCYTLQSCKGCCETNPGLERGLLEKYIEKTKQFVGVGRRGLDIKCYTQPRESRIS